MYFHISNCGGLHRSVQELELEDLYTTRKEDESEFLGNKLERWPDTTVMCSPEHCNAGTGRRSWTREPTARGTTSRAWPGLSSGTYSSSHTSSILRLQDIRSLLRLSGYIHRCGGDWHQDLPAAFHGWVAPAQLSQLNFKIQNNSNLSDSV